MRERPAWADLALPEERTMRIEGYIAGVEDGGHVVVRMDEPTLAPTLGYRVTLDVHCPHDTLTRHRSSVYICATCSTVLTVTP